MSNLANPFTQIFDALWSLVTDNAYLAEKIRPGNRMGYGDGEVDKDALSTADVPELRLMPAGGTLSPLRTSSSTSCTRRFVFQLHSGVSNLHETLLPVEWELMRAMVRWVDVVGALRWEREKYVVRMATIEITEDMLRPRPEFGEVGLKGWYTVWLCEVECFFNSEQMKEV